MYTNYNIPQKNYYTKEKYQNFKNEPNYISYNNDDRFVGGNFLAPFILGGIAGNLINRPSYYPRPVPVYLINGRPMPRPMPRPYPPYYNNTNIYY